MVARGLVQGVKPAILRQCRQQMGLSVDEVQQKVGIADMAAVERGEKALTFNQLDKLAKHYSVPDWVFIADELPPRYRLAETLPSFRQFADSKENAFGAATRRLLVAVERLRELLLDLRADQDDPVPAFEPPALTASASPQEAAEVARHWLEAPAEGGIKFEEWRARVESKGVFVFLTSKYQGQYKMDPEVLRGVSVHHAQLPLIIINDSDARKAQSFTLLHELGHLLRHETSLDESHYGKTEAERWCDQFAGSFLMPADQFRSAADSVLNSNSDIGLAQADRIAGNFNVSTHAAIVRMRILGIIEGDRHDELSEALNARNRNRKRGGGGPLREREKEALRQYGPTFSSTVLQAYHNGNLTLLKVSRMLGLNNYTDAMKLLQLR